LHFRHTANARSNGPSALIQGVETQWEQRFSFLPGLLSGIGVSANYSYVTSQITFPPGFNAPTVGGVGRTDKPGWNVMLPITTTSISRTTKARFSSRFAISHNDANIYAYQWGPGTGPANDPILGLKGPTGDQYLYPHPVRCSRKLSLLQGRSARGVRFEPEQRSIRVLQRQREISGAEGIRLG
jgi:hypothetical protein